MGIKEGTDRILRSQNGQRGSYWINDTNTHTGKWTLIHCLSACVFTTLTDATRESDGVTNISLITIPTGAVIGGTFTSVKLASGTCICYV